MLFVLARPFPPSISPRSNLGSIRRLPFFPLCVAARVALDSCRSNDRYPPSLGPPGSWGGWLFSREGGVGRWEEILWVGFLGGGRFWSVAFSFPQLLAISAAEPPM